MKIGLDFGETILGKYYPAGCVIDIFQPDAEALINAGRAHEVPDGTMARKKAYGVPGCMPPAEFKSSESERHFFAGAMLYDAKIDHGAGAKQKTNTLKK